MANLSKFNFQEIFSNDNGKSSGSGFTGVVICLVCSLSFMAGVVDKMFLSHTSDIMNSSIGFATLGAGLLGVRKFMQNKTTDIPAGVTEPAQDQPTETPAQDTPAEDAAPICSCGCSKSDS